MTPFVALAAAFLIEQYTYTVGIARRRVTAHLPIFRSIGGGVVVLPIEVLFFIGLLIWLMKAGLTRSARTCRSPPSRKRSPRSGSSCSSGFAIGLSKGGEFNIALWEMRPWMLMTAAYVFTATFVRPRDAPCGRCSGSS